MTATIAPNSVVDCSFRYDLKGSTYKRKASKAEKEKDSPTFKDLDFLEHHPEGLYLEPDTFHAMIKTIQRDCRVLESFKIMDYSLLVGIHNLDEGKDTDEAGEVSVTILPPKFFTSFLCLKLLQDVSITRKLYRRKLVCFDLKVRGPAQYNACVYCASYKK